MTTLLLTSTLGLKSDHTLGMQYASHAHAVEFKVKLAPIWNLISIWSVQASLEHGLHGVCSLGSILNQFWFVFLEKWALDGHLPGLSAHVK